MKTIFKIITIFAIFSVIAVFQACWDNCDEFHYYCNITDFEVSENWNDTLDTIDVSEVYFGLNPEPYWDCQNLCKRTSFFSNKAYAVYAIFEPIGDIASIEIFSDADYDSLHLAGSCLNDIFYFEVNPAVTYNDEYEILLSDVNFPIKPQYRLYFRMNTLNEPDSTSLHHFTLVYTETDSTVITKELMGITILKD